MVEDIALSSLRSNQPLKRIIYDLGHTVLPEGVQDFIRGKLRGKPVPVDSNIPFRALLSGYSADFWIETPSDYYRIVSGREGEYSHDIIRSVTASGTVFADIGSAQGYYSLLAASSGAEVYSFDPDPVSLSALQKNLILNPNFKNKVHIINHALGAIDGEMVLFVNQKGKGAPSLRRTQSTMDSQLMVPVSRFDTLVEQDKVQTPDIVKIDVEGAEGLVLEGMQEVLSGPNRPKDLFIELHPNFLPLFGTDIDSVYRQICRLGYKLVTKPQISNELYCHFIAG